MSSRLLTSRRELTQAFGTLAGAAAAGCGSEQQTAQQEDQLIQCFFNGREKTR